MTEMRICCFALCVVIFLHCYARSSVAIDFNYRVVVIKGVQAPGCPEGVLVARPNRPSIDAGGRVAFTSFLMDAGVTSANDIALFSEQFGMLDLVLREGDPAPGLDPSIFVGNIHGNIGGTSLLARNGYCAALVNLTGSVTSTDDTAIWINRGSGLEIVAREGDPAPDASPGLYGFFSPPILSADGKLAYRSRLGTLAQSPTGAWRETAATPSLVYIAGVGGGTAAPGTSGEFQSASQLVRNGQGHLAFSATIQGSGVTFANNTGIWRQADGPLTLFAREGDAAPGLGAGVEFDAFSNPHIDDLGRLGFTAFVRGTDVTIANNGGIWSEASGTLQFVMRLGDQAPDCPGGVLFAGFNAFSNEGFAMNSDGLIAFDAILTGPGVTAANNRGIWTQTAGGEVRKVARLGDAIDGIPEGVTYSFFQSFEINRPGLVVFDANLAGSGVTSANNAAIFAVQLGRPPRLVLRSGDPLEVAGGDIRTIAPLLRAASNVGTADGTPVTLNDHGQLAVYTDFSDTTNAVLVVDISACAMLGDMNLDQAVNGADVAVFVECVLGTSSNGCPCGDFDDDLFVTSDDVSGFVDAVLGS